MIIQCWDSLNFDNSYYLEKIIKNFEMYHNLKIKNMNNSQNFQKQENGYDCGLYVINNFLQLLNLTKFQKKSTLKFSGY